MNVINQFSYPIVFIVALFALYYILRRIAGVQWRYVAIVQVFVIVIGFGGFFLLRPGASDVDSVQAAQDMIGNGKPTFLEFFSNYCGACITFRPVVDTVVEDIEDEFNILRIDIHTDFGRELRRQLEFSFTPEFVLFDDAGNEIWRDHFPPAETQLNIARNN